MNHFPTAFPGKNLLKTINVHLLFGAAHVAWEQ
jgi:hypothetical protein